MGIDALRWCEEPEETSIRSDPEGSEDREALRARVIP